MGYRTLDRVIGELKTRGFVERFGVRDGQLRAFRSGGAFDAEDLTIREYQRFEGVSDPDGSSIVYVIELVVGARSTGGLARLLLGSVAEGVLDRSPVPVLLVK